MTHIGIILRRIRKDLGLRQVNVANKAHIARNYLNRIEMGKVKSPTLHTLDKVATSLGVPLSEIIDDWGQANAGKLVGELYNN